MKGGVSQVAEGHVAAIDFTPYIVVANTLLVSVLLIVAGRYLASGSLTTGVPGARQNLGEFVLDYFVRKARDMSHGLDRTKVVERVAPMLATFFLFILVSNLLAVFPIPKVNMPPTAFFGATLGLALASVGGTIVLGVMFKGPAGAAKHLFWPNPLQWVSEVTDVMSLSLRLFGNIAGEYMTLVLVAAVVPVGIPLILHVLGLIPSFVQALVFTLLTASFVASAIHKEEPKRKKARKRWSLFRRKPAQQLAEGSPGQPA